MVVSPITTQEWHARSTLNMGKTAEAHDMSLRQCAHSGRAHEEMGSGVLGMYHELRSGIQEKVTATGKLVDSLHDREASLRESQQKAYESMQQVQAALESTEKPLHLVRWRMQQRQSRPAREQVRDVVEMAFEEEESTLLEAQRRLQTVASETRHMLSELESRQNDVRMAISEKEQSLVQDNRCLEETTASLQQLRGMVPSAATPRTGTTLRMPSGGPGGRFVGPSAPEHVVKQSQKNELIRQRQIALIDRNSLVAENDAQARRAANSEVVATCDQAVTQANRKSVKAVQDRVAQNKRMQAALQGQVHETDHRIDHTSNTIGETRYQMKAMEEPSRLNAQCESHRSYRGPREAIEDPVATHLKEHHHAVLMATQELAGHHRSEKGHLSQLQQRRARLLEDLNDKAAAHKIDAGLLAETAPGNLGMSSRSEDHYNSSPTWQKRGELALSGPMRGSRHGHHPTEGPGFGHWQGKQLSQHAPRSLALTLPMVHTLTKSGRPAGQPMTAR